MASPAATLSHREAGGVEGQADGEEAMLRPVAPGPPSARLSPGLEPSQRLLETSTVSYCGCGRTFRNRARAWGPGARQAVGGSPQGARLKARFPTPLLGPRAHAPDSNSAG